MHFREDFWNWSQSQSIIDIPNEMKIMFNVENYLKKMFNKLDSNLASDLSEIRMKC